MTDATPAPNPGAIPITGPSGDRPRKSLLRERFEAVKDAAIDNAMDKGESWAKKVRTGDNGVMLDDLPRLISCIGLKLVEAGRICKTPQEIAVYEAYKIIATAHLAPQPTLEQDFDR